MRRKCWRGGWGFWYYSQKGPSIYRNEIAMKTLLRNAALIVFAAFAASGLVLAQTNAPHNQLPASKRFSGRIESVNPQAKSFILIGAAKEEILVSTNTAIFKSKQAVSFEDLAVGQQVMGMKRQTVSSNWVATTLRVGEQRTIPPEPASKQ